ncbi:unnamed protein product [Haemonchus placei]|uniref:Serpentine receptor class gamma n=1 Tax=Haemonchus placei TaxID=6290 RepID=A0A158QL45_HAEPC|nr:unnamed protein product [Haemonchus placei]
MLYFLLSLFCLTFDVFNIIVKVHHLTVSFLFVSPCDIIMPKAFFIAASLPLFYSIGAAQFAQMSMIVERWIATIFVRDYESGYRKLGPVLIAATVIINGCSMYIMYYGETFEVPQWNARSMPSTTYPRSSVVLLTLLILNFISLLVTIALMTLSSKFQSNENAIVSNLLFMISSLQFVTSLLAQLCGLYLRSYQFKNPLRFALRENFDLFNYYTLLLPILSTVYFKKVKRRRIKDITNKINVLINCCSTYIMYYGETFDAPQWNARMMPSTTYPQSSVVILTLLILNFISLLVTIALYIFSRMRRKTMTLSSKFQSNENAIVSNLLFMISSLQFATSFFAQMFGLYLRSYQSNNPLRFAFRENFDLFNCYTLLLPILSTIYFVKVKRRRIKDITNKINLLSTLPLLNATSSSLAAAILSRMILRQLRDFQYKDCGNPTFKHPKMQLVTPIDSDTFVIADEKSVSEE